MPTANESLPWYREPWPWLLMAGPAAVVVAGVYTMVLAIRSDDGLVAEDYYKQGMAINRELAREKNAQTLNISAQAEFAGDRVTVVVNAGEVQPPTLRLRIVHPTRAGEDRNVLVVAQGGKAYSAALPRLSHEARRLILEDPAATWRISGSLKRNAVVARLNP